MSRPSIVNRACTSGTLHDRAAAGAGAFSGTREEALEHRGELLLDIGELDELLVEQPAAALAVPLEAIELTDFEKQFPPVFERFFASAAKRTCARCGAVMERS